MIWPSLTRSSWLVVKTQKCAFGSPGIFCVTPLLPVGTSMNSVMHRWKSHRFRLPQWPLNVSMQQVSTKLAEFTIFHLNNSWNKFRQLALFFSCGWIYPKLSFTSPVITWTYTRCQSKSPAKRKLSPTRKRSQLWPWVLMERAWSQVTPKVWFIFGCWRLRSWHSRHSSCIRRKEL